MMNIRQRIAHHLYNIPGWNTNRHILVIESDDWGSVRMPSIAAYEALQKKGILLGRYGYEKVDTIASREDLSLLFEVCESHRDMKGNPVVITANCVVANPDFVAIQNSGYKEYFYEPITETMSRYYPGSSPFPLWKEGISQRVFFPQFHGREHVNVPLWLKSLQQNEGGARIACEKGVFSILVDPSFDKRVKNTASFHFINEEEKRVILQSVCEGIELFQKTFGYGSESMIAPSYHWGKEIEDLTSKLGIKYLQGLHTHIENGKRRPVFIGQQNEFGQRYLVRNAYFEYSQNKSFDWYSSCLKEVSAAFFWHKPATISTHRLNFIGGLDIANRDNNLRLFDRLLSDLQKRWPDLEFMTSVDVGNLISGGLSEGDN